MLAGFLILAARGVTFSERDEEGPGGTTRDGFFSQLVRWIYWSVTTVMGPGDSSGCTPGSAT